MNATPPDPAPAWLEVVREKVESLRFGVVQIVVHESRVTLIERTEKTKLDDAPAVRAGRSRRT